MSQIALVDDGELDDVAKALDELGLDCLRWRKGDPPPPSQVDQLLITTPNHALAFGYRRPVERAATRARWIVVTDDDSESMRKKVMGWGFDTFVCRPVHPAALLALLHEAVYAGDDRRVIRRVIVGADVTVRSGRRSIKSILIDAGPRGCRLLSEEPLAKGAKVTVQFPKSIAVRSFSHEGVVVRSSAFDSKHVSGVDLGVRFEPFSEGTKQLMIGVLNRHTHGPCTLRERIRSKLLGRDPNPCSPDVARQRRRAKRVVYESEVGIDGLASFALRGRDLSVKGLRVAPHEALTLGARLRLELHVEGRHPLMVDAEVTRLDGERGTVLTFDWVDGRARESMSSLVDGLPPVWSGSPSLLSETDTDPDTAPTLTDAVGRLVNRVLTRSRTR